MGKRILGQAVAQSDISASAPSGAAGIDMTLFLEAARCRWWLITAVVTVASSDLYAWGALPAGTQGDRTDDVWGKHQDEFATFPLGKIATALPAGTYHFIVDGLGLYSQVAFQKSAGTVNITLTEILDAGVGS